ncbi:MAG: type II toxin-antitoxin system VapC family toxin [Archangium sp.]|nr:type II toxin-antitoxin system VapC family toxin [Archangium sp.]
MLLDTNVVSELFRPDPEPNVLLWFQARARESVFLCAVTRSELLVGVMGLPHGKRRAGLLKSLGDILDAEFRTPCLPFDLNAAELCAELVSHRKRIGKPIAIEDAQIAAIALVHGLPVVTRNVSDFQRLPGLEVINPWED